MNGVPFEEGMVVHLAESVGPGQLGLFSAQGRTPEGEAQPGASELTFDLGRMNEGWYVSKLMGHAAAGRLDLDGPIAKHLPFFNKGTLAMLTTRQVIDHSAHLGGKPYGDWLSANSFLTPYKCQSFLASLGCDDTPGERPEWRESHVDTMRWLCGALGDEAPTHFTLKEFADSLHAWREHATESLALREAALLQGFHTVTPASLDPPLESLSAAMAAKRHGTTWKIAAVTGSQESSVKRLDTSRQFVLSPVQNVSR